MNHSSQLNICESAQISKEMNSNSLYINVVSVNRGLTPIMEV